jgi:UDP-2,4-diacetamido-2,4,6-trideoxy-beta-L-altropyranose hydrolase
MNRANLLGEATLLIRADASVAMGTGHVMRCVALAQAWQDEGGKAVFAMSQSTPAILARLKTEGMEVHHVPANAGTAEDAHRTSHLARKENAGWIVVDGYQFGSAYQSAIKTGGFKMLFIDDYGHAAPYSADLVLNQNLQADRELYSQRDSSAKLLLGPRYAMLRREFRVWRDWHREIPAAGRKILLTMGGSDPDNLTSKVIAAIAELSMNLSALKLETMVLVGGSNPHLGTVKASAQHESMRVITDSICVAELMAQADVAVTGAGTTFWEMCFLGLPAILLVLAENQQAVADSADKMEIAWSLGRATEVSPSVIAERLAELLSSKDIRAKQSDIGRKLVDGRGAERVVAFLSGLGLRPTRDSDCEVFWAWANNPDTRAASFCPKAIPWEEHAQWFQAKRADPNAILYTATNRDGLPVGEVRYQIEGKRAVVSINLGAEFRGQGWGKKVLTLATEEFFQDSEVEFIDAYVKPGNEASLRLFTSAGFLRRRSKVIEGQEGIHFVLERKALP